MGVFLDAAYKVLKKKGDPLSAQEITQIGEELGYLESQGNTPWQTMKSKLSTDILTKGDQSVFMRSARGYFALREWKPRIPEHIADRYQKVLFDEDIVVFPAISLPNYISGHGLFKGEINSKSLYDEIRPMRRLYAEQDFQVIQLISVFLIHYNEQLLTYKRTKRLPESRLHGYYSIAFGGHLNPDDIKPLFNIFKPELGRPWLVRELREEVRFDEKVIQEINYRGLLYDDSRPVSSQHLGIVYDVIVNTDNFQIGERGFLIDAKYETLASIRDRIDQFENWSVLLLKECETDE